MAIKTRTELKAYFQGGKRPTESQFANLIDSLALRSEISSEPSKPYKVFSAMLRIDNDSIQLGGRPIYVVRYTLLEPNTIGDLEFSLTRDDKIKIENNVTFEGILPFARRVITFGTLRTDFNFDHIFESDDQSDQFIDLIFSIKSDGMPLPETMTPLFNNLPIEIRVYDEFTDSGQSLPFHGGIADPGTELPADRGQVNP